MKEEEGLSDEDGPPEVVSTFYEGKTEVFDIKEKAKKMNKKVETKGIPDVRYVKKTKPKEEDAETNPQHSLAAGLLKWSNTFTHKMPFGIPKELSHQASENFAKKLENLGPKKSTRKKSDQSKINKDELDVFEEESDKFKKNYYSKKYVFYKIIKLTLQCSKI